jgi:hypothetical protein
MRTPDSSVQWQDLELGALRRSKGLGMWTFMVESGTAGVQDK